MRAYRCAFGVITELIMCNVWQRQCGGEHCFLRVDVHNASKYRKCTQQLLCSSRRSSSNNNNAVPQCYRFAALTL